MNTYIGIDLGTSGAKFLLVAADGTILAENTQSYPVFYPHPGWSEQNPDDWFAAAIRGLNELLKGQEKSAVKGISFGGQMHGLVALDKADKVIRPAILWNDGRTEKQTAYLNEVVGKDKLSAYTGNIAFAGFTAPKILWMKENEPENFACIAKIMLPKDYLAYRLSGAFCTDFSDASGMLLLDVKNRRWSKEMCNVCGISEQMLPELHESYEVVGTLKREIAEELGLSADVKIIAGAGDNAAAAVGTGVVGEGGCNISLGTSGTLFVSSERYKEDKVNALHSFCHADGGWHLMGCILSAASCNAWWSDHILQTKDYAKEQEGVGGRTRQKRRVFPAVSDGRAQPAQRREGAGRVHRDASRYDEKTDDARGVGGRNVRPARLPGSGKKERREHRTHQTLRRGSKEPALVQNYRKHHGYACRYSADGAGTFLRRGDARNGRLRGV